VISRDKKAEENDRVVEVVGRHFWKRHEGADMTSPAPYSQRREEGEGKPWYVLNIIYVVIFQTLVPAKYRRVSG
jgi:hypothetical protein